MFEPKYEMTDITKEFNGHTLHRIQALRDFSDVKKGDLGGFIEKKENLSDYGNCWVYDDGMVFDSAHVHGGARVRSSAQVYGNASVNDTADVFGSARVYGNASVNHNVCVAANARICGNAKLGSLAYVGESAFIDGPNEILGIEHISPSNGIITFYLTEYHDIMVSTGYFVGTIEKFLEMVTDPEQYSSEYVTRFILAVQLVKAVLVK